MGAAALANNQFSNGIRPVNLRTDLAGLAELLEICFGPTMDESGRAAIREYRMISRSGPLTALFTGLNDLLGGLEQGFVWIEDGRLVGNVSISPANYPRAFGVGYIIANVAVHPEYRRRGLARALMVSALDLIRKKNGDFAVLQVDATNNTAHRLYTRLGFRDERTFIRWQRSSHIRPPLPLQRMPDITLRQPNEWNSEYTLAQLVRPNVRGGLGWLRPTSPDLFRPSLLHSLGGWITGHNQEHWIIRDPGDRHIVASLRVSTSFGSADKLELIVHPAYQNQYEDALVNFVLRRLDGYLHPVVIEHPADDLVTQTVLERYQFQRRQDLIHMRYDFA